MRRAVTSGVWWLSPRGAAVASFLPAVLAIFICAHQLTLHGVLHGVVLHNETAGLASSIAVTRGALPYANYALAQPPGMTLLLLPFAGLSHIVAGSVVLPLARFATAAVTVLAVYMAGFTVRSHGIPAAVLTGVFTAVYPFEFFSSGGVTVGPWILAITLIGVNSAFRDGMIGSRTRVFIGLFFLGFACTIKPWAAIPAILVLGCVVASADRRDRILPALGGIALGGGVPCLAFLLAAPGAFWRDAVITEFPGHGTEAAAAKLATVLGFGSPSGFVHPDGLATVVTIVIVVVVLGVCVAGYQGSLPEDWFLSLCAVGLLLMAVAPGRMGIEYGEFALPFVAIGVTMAVSRMTALIASSWSGRATDPRSIMAASVAVLMAASSAIVAGLGAASVEDYAASYANHHALIVRAIIDHDVKGHACAISNSPLLLIEANRFSQNGDKCPFVVDPTGLLAISAANPQLPAVSNSWISWLGSAHDVVLAPPFSSAPVKELGSFLRHNYTVVGTEHRVTIYQRTVS